MVYLFADISCCVGVLVYQMVIGETPLPRTFREDPEVDFGVGVAKKHINAHIRVYQDQARGRKLICQFMRDCLQFDPSDRPALEKLLSHPWLKGPDRPALKSIPCPDALRVILAPKALFGMLTWEKVTVHVLCAGDTLYKHT